MDEQYDYWRIAELEDAWQLLSDEEKAEITRKSLERQKQMQESLQAWRSMTPEQKEILDRDTAKVLASHNILLSELMEQFTNART